MKQNKVTPTKEETGNLAAQIKSHAEAIESLATAGKAHADALEALTKWVQWISDHEGVAPYNHKR